jgi:hypothetical protein
METPGKPQQVLGDVIRAVEARRNDSAVCSFHTLGWSANAKESRRPPHSCRANLRRYKALARSPSTCQAVAGVAGGLLIDLTFNRLLLSVTLSQ